MHLVFDSIRLYQDSLGLCTFTNPFILWKEGLRTEAAQTTMQPEKLAATLHGKHSCIPVRSSLWASKRKQPTHYRRQLIPVPFFALKGRYERIWDTRECAV